MSTRRSRSPAPPAAPPAPASATGSGGAISSSGRKSGEGASSSAADAHASRKRGRPGRPPGRPRGGGGRKSGGGASDAVPEERRRGGRRKDGSDSADDDDEDLLLSSSRKPPPSGPPPACSTEPRPIVLLGPQPRGMYECDYCGSDLTLVPRVRCASCPDFDLCIECFATEDHERMAGYKREEEARRRREAAELALLVNGGVPLEEEAPTESGISKRGSKRKGRGGDDEDEALGSYVGGVWVPYFRHSADHGYLVADSTRYTIFPSFRGVQATETAETPNEWRGEKKEKGEEDKKENGIEGGAGSAKETGINIEKTASATSAEGGSAEQRKEEEEKDIGKEAENKIEVAKDDAMEADEDVTKGGKESNASTMKTDALDVAMEADFSAKDGENANEESSGVTKDEEKNNEESADVGLEVSYNPKDDEGANMESTKDSSAKDDGNGNKERAMNSDAKDGGKANKESNDSDDLAMDTEATVETSRPRASNASKRVSEAKPTSQPKKYRFTDDPKNAWTAEEDLRLLDAILTCGLGNWPDIAEHVNGGTSGEGTASASGTDTGSSAGGNTGGGGVVASGGKTDKRCMERYLDDFMGRYGCVLPTYTMVPDGIKEEDEDSGRHTPATADSSDGEGEPGVGRRKRPRRSAASGGCGLAEVDKFAPGFGKTKFKVVPTEELDDFKSVWSQPYLPPGTKMGEDVGRDLWYRSEQSYVRQTTASGTSKVGAEAMRKEFMDRRARNLAGYEAKVLPPRLEDTKSLPGAELAGYMPRRGDFDMEWDNEAEKIISEMEFSLEDTRADRDLKLDVIRIFNAKLDERERRKRFIVERMALLPGSTSTSLLHYRENQERMWRLPLDERHLLLRMRPFARFQTQEEHEAFVGKVLEAKRLRKEIAKLQLYRRLGIITLAEAERYEIDKARREVHRTAWIKKEEERRNAEEEAARAARENSIVVAPASSGACATSVVGSAATPSIAGVVPVGGVGDRNGLERGLGLVGAAANQSLQVWKQFKRFDNKSSLEKEDGNDVAREKGSSSPADPKFVIRDKPGYELLSRKEIGLCKRLCLLPRQYLNVKKALIAESLKQGILGSGDSNNGSKSIFKVDIRQQDGIIDFMLEAGWIPTRPSIC